MKIYSLEEIQKLSQNADYCEENEEPESNNYSLQEFDYAKTKVLKYVLYKKRSEKEVIKKFENVFNSDLLSDVISNLKEKGYIDDENYIKKSVNEFITLRNLSMYEIKYKLITKGINTSEIEDYFSKNYEMLLEYEENSAKNIVKKKISKLDIAEIKQYLMKKGYKSESIREALNNFNLNK